MKPASKLHRWWNFYLDYTDGCVYQFTLDSFTRYTPDRQGFHRDAVLSWQPNETSFPVATFIHSNILHLHLDHLQFKPNSLPCSTQPKSFLHYLLLLPEWESSLFSSLQLYYSPFEILQLLDNIDIESSKPCLFFVSDGSKKHHLLSFAWNLHSSDGILLCCCAGPGTGPGTSHCGEAYGFLSAIRFVFHFRQYTSTTTHGSLISKQTPLA